jgi:hypothetical protein
MKKILGTDTLRYLTNKNDWYIMMGLEQSHKIKSDKSKLS